MEIREDDFLFSIRGRNERSTNCNGTESKSKAGCFARQPPDSTQASRTGPLQAGLRPLGRVPALKGRAQFDGTFGPVAVPKALLPPTVKGSPFQAPIRCDEEPRSSSDLSKTPAKCALQSQLEFWAIERPTKRNSSDVFSTLHGLDRK